ncbi:MAG: hypothetical protein RMJ56_01490 [Gemmataceae bacterium]|nr:hypothetical protein [Gemmata sp.]MDW8196255.1 hypothetical protein [Gemmataceae bacterium]
MSVCLACPSCNTQFTLAILPADRRVICPRCGDRVPLRGQPDATAALPSSATAALKPSPATLDSPAASSPALKPAPRTVDALAAPSPTHRSSSRRQWLALLAVGAVVIGLAVYFTPRPHPPTAERPAATVVPPRELSGLGFLPERCNVVFAFQPGPALAFAERRQQPIRELLTEAGIPPQLFSFLDQLGIPLPQIHHLVGGAFLGDAGEPPQALVVVVLQQPIADEEHFLARLQAKPAPGKAPHYNIQWKDSPLPLGLARLSATVWVVGWVESVVMATKTHHGPGGPQLRLGRLFDELPADAALWAIADDASDWTQKPLVKLLAPPNVQEWLPVVRDGRGAYLALCLAPPPRLQLMVRAADDTIAQRVRTYFHARAAEIATAQAGGDGPFAHFVAPFDPATSARLLQRFLADAK